MLRDTKHLSDLLAEAISFKGLSYVDVIEPCIIWGTHNVDWYKERIYKLPPEYDPSDRARATEKAIEWGDRIPTGVIYREDKPRTVFGDHFREKVHKGKLVDLGFPPRETIEETLGQFL